MQRILKLMQQMRDELEEASLHYDMDEALDLFEQFEDCIQEIHAENEDDD